MTYTIPKAVDRKNLSAKALKSINPIGMEVQAKYDGCAVRFDALGGRVSAVSATGNEVKSLDSQRARLFDCVAPGSVIIAEVWHNYKPFQEVSGLFRRHEQADGVVCVIHDGYIAGMQEAPYSERMAALRKHVGWEPGFISAATDRVCQGWEHAEELAMWWTQNGRYDGVVLKDTSAPFIEGRSKGHIIKVKPTLTFDLEVIGYESATGEVTGRPTVALMCRWKNGLIQRVATGLDHTQQSNPQQFVGGIVEVGCMGFTASGLMREPRFIGQRFDKAAPDF